jgi:hypothetical protein
VPSVYTLGLRTPACNLVCGQDCFVASVEAVAYSSVGDPYEAEDPCGTETIAPLPGSRCYGEESRFGKSGVARWRMLVV